MARPGNQNYKQHDFESLTVILSVAMVVSIGSLMTSLSTWEGSREAVSTVKGYSIPAHLRGSSSTAPTLSPEQGAQQAFRGALNEPQSEAEQRLQERFQQAIALLHAKRYDYAIAALDSVLAISPNMPEAYVNMGFAFLGLEEFGPARGAFEKALEIKLDQVNAYYGLAIAFEGQGEFEAALGAMRSYIHLSPPDDPHLVKARAALWEWEAQLGRIDGVRVAAEGEEVPELPKPSWSQKH
jgi:tetratricopeptide (TPR) repeat protein